MPAAAHVLGRDAGSVAPALLAVLAIHVLAGLTAVITGAAAALARKGGSRHRRAGRWFYRAIGLVFVTATVLAALRWRQDYRLFIVGAAAFAAATAGYQHRRRRRPGDAGHIAGLGAGYVAMLTAFYVDNGPHLPLWDRLPPLAFWLLPSAIGAPIIVRSVLAARNRYQQATHRRLSTGAGSELSVSASSGETRRMAGRLPDDFRYLLACQCGVFARWQASEMAVDPGVITARLRSGRWQRLYFGVYAAFTGRLSREAELWAAVLWAGPQAVLSHQTAAELDGFGGRPSRLIHVTVPLAQHRVGVAGVVMHRSGRLEAARHPLRTPPRTRVEETALDLAQLAATFDDAFGWISRPCSERLTTPGLLLHALQSRGKVRRRAELTLALADVADGVHSPLEHRYVHNVERPHGLPAAERQVLITRRPRRQYLDNLYREFGIGVELDGQASHPAGERWRDIGRDNLLAARGILVLRYGWADVSDRPCQVASQIGHAAGKRGWAGVLRRCGPGCCVARP